MRFHTMGAMSNGLGEMEQEGPTMSQPTRHKNPGQEAHN
jgi:hypothetical protein